jgi:hypothetical protein
MKRVLTGIIALTGVALLVFILNIILYAAVPGYRQILLGAVNDNARAADISAAEASEPKALEGIAKEPVQEIDKAGEQDLMKEQNQAEVQEQIPAADNSGEAFDYSAPEDTPDDGEKQSIIIDKEYHEDCGTGKGYWVITYSDGTKSVE